MIDRRERIVHNLLLDTKQVIPFPSARLIIYQPSIAEIGLINEPSFLTAINAITKNYKTMKVEDNSDLDSLSNFDILMSIMRENTEASKKIFKSVFSLLELIFPTYNIRFTPSSFIFIPKDIQGEKIEPCIIDKNNFDEFAQIIYEMFGLAALLNENAAQDYNPAGDRARALVEKFQKKREYLAQLRKERGEDISMSSVFGRYINILAVGEHKDKNELSKYSVYQLIEEFKRFQLKEAFDYTLQAKMAGATKIKDAKDWMQDTMLGSDTEE
jgi:hypothetical protein